MASAIADASVLIHLSKVDHLRLLEQLFENVLVPDPVWEEVVIEGHKRPGSDQVQQALQDGWMERRAPSHDAVCRVLEQTLGSGESGVIALGLEMPAARLLIDEKDARNKAKALDLDVTGTIGLLVRAHQESYLDDLEGTLRNLREHAGFWISDLLLEEALRRGTKGTESSDLGDG